MFRFIALLLLALLPASRVHTASSVDSLEAVVGQWIALKQEHAAEQTAWKMEEQAHQWEMDLLDARKAELTQQVADLASPPMVHNTTDLAEELRGLEEQVAAIHQAVDRSSTFLEGQRKRVPAGLTSSLPAPVAKTGGASERLHQALALHAAFSNLHNRVHVTRELRVNSSGASQLYDVVYLGMARALAVSPDNKTALIGQPTARAWTWTPANDQATAIRRLIQIQSGAIPPDFVELPFDEVTP